MDSNYLLRVISASAAWLFVAQYSAAADMEQTFVKYSKMVSDDAARDSMKLALTKIHTAQCEANRPCAPAKPEEFSQMPIALEDGRAAMTFAIISALSQWCGLDWKRSFLPMIGYGKYKKKMSDRQLQLMTLIHSDFMGRQLAFYVKSGKTCPQELRTQFDGDLPKLSGDR